MRLTALAATLAIAGALPAFAQSKIENAQMVVYEGQWVQTKVAGQGGALMFLTLPRGQKGEYFSISCAKDGSGVDRTIKLGFPRSLGDSAPVSLDVDGKTYAATATFTGKAHDPNYTKADIHTYAVKFADEAEKKAVFDAMRAGKSLSVDGQSVPVDLKGFSAAYAGQAQFCE